MSFKRLKLSAESPPLEHTESNHSCDDLFEQLPDEILLNIMYFLPLGDATRTSILSHRWKNLWKFNMVLEFNPPKYDMNPPKYDMNPISLEILEERRKNYSTWVNQVLKSHEGAVIEAFVISFDLGNMYKSELDRWIEYAVRKRATVLEIDLRWGFSGNHSHHVLNFYTFPKQVLCYSSIKVLTYLHLRCVEVSGSVLENILSMCPNLRNLGVFKSPTLLGLKVCDVSSPQLKYLDIRFCRNMNYLEISGPNLIRLIYYGPTIMLQIHHAPKLVTFWTGLPLSSELSPYFPQIQNLRLEYMLGVDWEITPPHEFPKFNVLKHLDLTVHTKDEDSLLPFMSLIERCPMLHMLEVEFEWDSRERSSRKVEERRGEELKCLKVLKYRRFYGHTADIELVIAILANAPYLEKVIFDPWDSISQREKMSEAKDVSIWDLILNDKRRAARECAGLLVKKHSPNAKLVLL